MDSTNRFENKKIACLCAFGDTNENIAGKIAVLALNIKVILEIIIKTIFLDQYFVLVVLFEGESKISRTRHSGPDQS